MTENQIKEIEILDGQTRVELEDNTKLIVSREINNITLEDSDLIEMNSGWSNHGQEWANKYITIKIGAPSPPATTNVDYKYWSKGFQYWVKGSIPKKQRQRDGNTYVFYYAGYVNRKIAN